MVAAGSAVSRWWPSGVPVRWRWRALRPGHRCAAAMAGRRSLPGGRGRLGRAARCGWPGRPRAGVDDYDWESLHGGGFVALDPGDGHVVISGSLPDDVAWGTGGGPVVALGSTLCRGRARPGRLHLLDRRLGAVAVDSAAGVGLARYRPCGLGGTTVLFGFNRGGYRLWTSGPDHRGGPAGLIDSPDAPARALIPWRRA